MYLFCFVTSSILFIPISNTRISCLFDNIYFPHLIERAVHYLLSAYLVLSFFLCLVLRPPSILKLYNCLKFTISFYVYFIIFLSYHLCFAILVFNNIFLFVSPFFHKFLLSPISYRRH